MYGYEDKGFPIFFSQTPLLQVGGWRRSRVAVVARRPTRRRCPDPLMDPAMAAALRRQRPRVIVRFHQIADSLLISGQLNGGAELAGKAAVVDAPVGSGHVVMFATRPFWRWQTQGAMAMALNSIVNWNVLGR